MNGPQMNRIERPVTKHNGAGPRRRMRWTRLQSDERLVASVRSGNDAAFAELVRRYRPWLLAICRQLVRSREDAEDLVQDVFASAYKAMLADERPIQVRPWLYKITRNRSLNHLRRAKSVAIDTIDEQLSDNGASTADAVHGREELRLLVGDINELPEAQRSALVLREMGALSYEQIAETMEKSVPSVKSLLVRARRSLTAAAEARAVSAEEIGTEAHTGVRPAALAPFGPLVVLLKKLGLGHLGQSGGAGATATGAGIAGSAAIAGSSAAPLLSAGLGAIATKAAAGLAAAALVTAGAVAVDNGGTAHRRPSDPAPVAASAAGGDEAAAQTGTAVALAPVERPSEGRRSQLRAATTGAPSRDLTAALTAPAPTATSTTTTTTTTSLSTSSQRAAAPDTTTSVSVVGTASTTDAAADAPTAGVPAAGSPAIATGGAPPISTTTTTTTTTATTTASTTSTTSTTSTASTTSDTMATTTQSAAP